MTKQAIIKTALIAMVIVLFGVISIYAQTSTMDVLYMKNGDIIKGTIVERVSDQTIKINTMNGTLLIKVDDIQKIRKNTERTNIHADSPKSTELSVPPPPPPPLTEAEVLNENIRREHETQNNANTAPNYFILADNLYKEYFFDCNYTLERYENKVISVNGKIIYKFLSSDGNFKSYTIFLEGGLNANEIYCVFDESQLVSSTNYQWVII